MSKRIRIQPRAQQQPKELDRKELYKEHRWSWKPERTKKARQSTILSTGRSVQRAPKSILSGLSAETMQMLLEMAQ